ncbi:sulfur carrier protein ThiS [Zunongwangia profunda]|uniref:sulfur carrier protein ThiS n=1 Tax=Zunongwangia profunda TaxID=398743 RepID=UPI001D185330|nr:sulfur carrier protein ThiS [Zunongwangia profunda]MCC4230499.1 sulfur carrier protein ThiS [Zunongwangia profunda]|tara:strand:- start:10 stop:213 length:204 start_codon:yes stop_codon:yes gene_type:complete
MITVNVNNQNHSFKEPVKLDELLEQLNIQPLGIAIAINNEIISKPQWEHTLVEEGSNVLVIRATQGG